jgi:uncharacterized delta-60 repeat protein
MRRTVLVEALLSLGARPMSAARAAGLHWITTTCTALLILGLGQVAGAAPGDLDPSFDADGLVLTHFGRIDDDSPGGRSDTGVSVVAQPDGKLVVAGSSNSFDTFEPGDFALARYNSDGSLDSSFGSGGRVLTDFGAFDFANTLIVQRDGKLVAGGLSFGETANDVLALARYNQDGSLDATFGSDGRLLMSSLSVPCCIGGNELVAEPGGKLVATAISFDAEENRVPTLVRLNPDGSLDASFGSGGVVTDFTGEAQLGSLGALVLQPDGKLVVAGQSFEFSANGFTDSIFLARFNPNGTLDSTFGSDGRVSTEGPFFNGILVRQPDGKLVAVGVSRNDSGAFSLFTLVRYNSNGSLDASFGSGGRVVTDGVGIESGDLVLDPDGNFVAAGEFFVPGTGTGSVFAIARLNPDGSLDASFGAGGRVVTDFSQRSAFFRSTPYALAVQPDGKLVAAGSSNVSGDEDFALARYLVTNERPERPPKCGGHRATVLGTPGNDTLRGTFFGRDVILGLGGNDTIRGLGGTDILCGGPGNDVLIGGDESDWLYGGSGNDRLFADRGLSAVDGDDALYGGPGADMLMGDDGNDLLSGGGGKDRLFGDRGDDALNGGSDRDRCRDRFGRNTLDNCGSGAGRPPTDPPRDPPPAPCLGRFCPEAVAPTDSQ